MFLLVALISTIFGDSSVNLSSCEETRQESLNVVFVLDSSSSMNSSGARPYKLQWNVAKKLLRELVDAHDGLEQAIHVGVVEFTSHANTMHEISPDYNRVLDHHVSKPMSGYTKIKPGIRRAESLLQTYNDKINRGRNLIVLFSDGETMDCGWTFLAKMPKVYALYKEKAETIRNDAKKCKSKYPILALRIDATSRLSRRTIGSKQVPNYQEVLMITLSECDHWVRDDDSSWRDSSAAYKNGTRCPFYVSVRGEDAYEKVERAAAEVAQTAVRSLRRTCREEFHVRNRKCVPCAGHPAGDDKCGEDTQCASSPVPPVTSAPASTTLPVVVSVNPSSTTTTEVPVVVSVNPPSTTTTKQPVVVSVNPPSTTTTEVPVVVSVNPPSTTTTEVPVVVSVNPPSTTTERPAVVSVIPSTTTTTEQPVVVSVNPPSTTTTELPVVVSVNPPSTITTELPVVVSVNPPSTTTENHAENPNDRPITPNTDDKRIAESSDVDESNSTGFIVGGASMASMVVCVLCLACYIKQNKKQKNNMFAEDEEHHIELTPSVPIGVSQTANVVVRHQEFLENALRAPGVSARQARSSGGSRAKRAKRATQAFGTGEEQGKDAPWESGSHIPERPSQASGTSNAEVKPRPAARKAKKDSHIPERPSEASGTSGADVKPKTGARKAKAERISRQPSMHAALE